MIVSKGEVLFFGLFELEYCSLQVGFCEWVNEQIGYLFGYFEQFYIFVDCDWFFIDWVCCMILISYFGFVCEQVVLGVGVFGWYGWYEYFFWEDYC